MEKSAGISLTNSEIESVPHESTASLTFLRSAVSSGEASKSVVVNRDERRFSNKMI